MVKSTYAIAGILAGLGFGYYMAYSQVKKGMCNDPNFLTNITPIKGKCPTASTIELMEYYSRLGQYSNIPR